MTALTECDIIRMVVRWLKEHGQLDHDTYLSQTETTKPQKVLSPLTFHKGLTIWEDNENSFIVKNAHGDILYQPRSEYIGDKTNREEISFNEFPQIVRLTNEKQNIENDDTLDFAATQKFVLSHTTAPDKVVLLNPAEKQTDAKIKLQGVNDTTPAIDVDGLIKTSSFYAGYANIDGLLDCQFIQATNGAILQNSIEINGSLICKENSEVTIKGVATCQLPTELTHIANKEYIDTNFIPVTGTANVGALSLYLTNPIAISLGRHKNIEMTGSGSVYFLESASLYGDDKALFQIVAEPSTLTSITNKAYVDTIKSQIISEFSGFMEHTLLKDIVEWQPASIKLTQFIDYSMTEQAIFYLIDNYYKDVILLSPRSIHFQHTPSTPNTSKGIYDMYINPDRVDESGHFFIPAIKIVDDSQRSDTELHYDVFYWEYKGYQGAVPNNPITTIARIGRSINYMGSGDLSFLTLSTTRVSNTSPTRALRIYDKCEGSQSINNILRLQSDDFGSRWIALQSSADDIIDETHDEIAKIPEIIEAPPAIYKRYAIKKIGGKNMKCVCLSEFVQLSNDTETLVRDLYIKPIEETNEAEEPAYFNRIIKRELKPRYFFK